jgi:hypothetical protein
MRWWTATPRKLLVYGDGRVLEARQFLQDNQDNLSQEGQYDQAMGLLTV